MAAGNMGHPMLESRGLNPKPYTLHNHCDKASFVGTTVDDINPAVPSGP